MLQQAASNIEKEHQNLSKLDAVTGDGDHGVTILRSMKAVTAAIEENKEKPMAEMIKSIAMKVMMCDGGSTSPLLGSYFLGLSMAAPVDELTAEETSCMFEAGLANFQKTSKASVGDKTMMDALRPATEELMRELSRSGDIHAAFGAASVVANEGAEKTREYVAKFGRARTMGMRAVGHLDPGAMSISYIFKGFAEAS
jgi:dihydroxyacetone kinase-like protein